MNERTCSKCNITKDASEFPFRNKLKGTRHSYCLVCGREWVRGHYARNVKRYVQKARKRRKQVVNVLNEKIYNYLETHPCVDCGETDPIVLEFDHVRGQKSYEISTLSYRLASWNTVLKEIAKCEVRCANCHRRKTAEQRGTYRFIRRNGPLAQFG
jgi:hypothetical protein